MRERRGKSGQRPTEFETEATGEGREAHVMARRYPARGEETSNELVQGLWSQLSERLPAALLPLGKFLVVLLFPEAVLALGLASAVGDGVAAVAGRSAAKRLEGLSRFIQRIDRRVHRHRRDLSDAQVADLLGRQDVLHFMLEARNHLALEEFDDRMSRFAEVIADRAATRGEAQHFDRDLHFARAALELSDDAILALEQLVQARAADRTGERAPRLAEDQALGLVGVQELVGGRLPSAEVVEARHRDLRALESWEFAIHSDSHRGPRVRLGTDDGGAVLLPRGSWYVTELGAQFLSIVRNAEGRGQL